MEQNIKKEAQNIRKEAQNIRKEAQGGQNTVQPIDRSDEVLINPEISFNELLCILRSRPEMRAAARLESKERERESRESRLRAKLGKDYEAAVEGMTEQQKKKQRRRPGAAQLRNEVSRLVVKRIGDDATCEVFVNGYAVYDNGNRKTVVWVPGCGTATYNFTKLRDNEKQYQVEKDTVGMDVFGPAPWYIALTVAGENNIERNLDHPKSVGTMSDTDDKDDFATKAAYRWVGGTHFDNPEEAYIKKEAEEERRAALTEKQREAYDLFFHVELTQVEIAQKLGVSQPAVARLLDRAIERCRKTETAE